MAGRFDSFVILAEMRTGSNLLEAHLNEIPGVTCHGEAFNPHFIGHSGVTEMLGVTLQAREQDPLRLLDAMRADDAVAMPGFRFFHDHDPRVLKRVLADKRCAKIVLTRNPAESYVSLQIARATDQWKLGDMRHQKSARIRFDAAGFEDHLDRLQRFQLAILRSLQITGQTAYYLAYEDLGELEVINGIAAYLGVKGRLEALSGKLKKQNPAPLAEKVENFDEMQAALARLDRFDLTRTPSFEPRRGPVVPGYVAAAEAPLLFMPVKGGPEARVEAWLAALDGVDPGALRRSFTQKTLRQWKRQNPGHRSFTVVRHPLARAHDSFCRYILSTGDDSYPVLREALAKTYGVPLPPEAPGADYGPDAHRAAFLAFLKFLKGNLSGQTSLRVDPAWASQEAVIQGFAQFALPDMVLRDETLVRDLAQLAEQAGLAAPALAETPEPGPVPLAEIYDEEIETAAREAYQRDYMMFGYRAWE